MSLAWLVIIVIAVGAPVLIGFSVTRRSSRTTQSVLPDEGELRHLFDEHEITAEELRDRSVELLQAREGQHRLIS